MSQGERSALGLAARPGRVTHPPAGEGVALEAPPDKEEQTRLGFISFQFWATCWVRFEATSRVRVTVSVRVVCAEHSSDGM